MNHLSRVTRPLCAARILLGLVSAASVMGSVGQAAELSVHSNARCVLLVDGRSQATIEPGKTLDLKLPGGKHRLEAVATALGAKWDQVIVLPASDAHQEVSITFAESLSYWLDPETKLMWTAADNGSGVSWSQALRYCNELTAAGFRDWTLPSIDDLQRIFDPSRNQGGYHVKGPLKLTGWQWSATPGAQKGEGWALDFGDGGRASVAAGDSGLNRALCIRRPSSPTPHAAPSRPATATTAFCGARTSLPPLSSYPRF